MSSTYEIWPPDVDRVEFSTTQLSRIELIAARAFERAPHELEYRVFEIPHVNGFESLPARPLRDFLPPLLGPMIEAFPTEREAPVEAFDPDPEPLVEAFPVVPIRPKRRRKNKD